MNRDLNLEITPSIRLRAEEIQIDFVQAAGPGGQNVNKTATAARLRFDATGSSSLPEAVKVRLLKLGGRRVTLEGVLLIEARRFRTQEANREDALRRLSALIRKASIEPRKRKATRPSQASREERLQEKKRRSEIKKARRSGTEF